MRAKRHTRGTFVSKGLPTPYDDLKRATHDDPAHATPTLAAPLLPATTVAPDAKHRLAGAASFHAGGAR